MPSLSDFMVHVTRGLNALALVGYVAACKTSLSDQSLPLLQECGQLRLLIAMRSAVRASSAAPEKAAACSISCRKLS